MNYKNKINIERSIELYLNDIDGYTKSAYLYLCGREDLDKDEIIMYLSSVSETIEIIKDYILMLEEIYEKEILNS